IDVVRRTNESHRTGPTARSKYSVCVTLTILEPGREQRDSFFMLSGTGTPRKRAPGKVGVPTKEMKNKGSETEPKEHQCSDGHDEEAFEDKCGRAPTQH